MRHCVHSSYHIKAEKETYNNIADQVRRYRLRQDRTYGYFLHPEKRRKALHMCHNENWSLIEIGIGGYYIGYDH